MSCFEPPEASLSVLADVVLQVGLRQHGAPGNLLRQTHKQTTCNGTCQYLPGFLMSSSNIIREEVPAQTSGWRLTSSADSCGADGRTLRLKTETQHFLCDTKGIFLPVRTGLVRVCLLTASPLLKKKILKVLSKSFSSSASAAPCNTHRWTLCV